MQRNTTLIALAAGLLVLFLAPQAWTDGDPPDAPARIKRIEIPDGHVLDVFTIGGRDGELKCIHFEPASGQLRYDVRYDFDGQLLEVHTHEGTRTYRYAFFRPVRWDVYKF